jgi:hypothetical protein
MLVLLALVAIALIPPYYLNYQFQQYLHTVVDRPQSPERMQASIVDKAARLGLPVRSGDVRVTRSGNGVRVEIVYVVKVDLPMYTVDLHFRPGARSD